MTGHHFHTAGSPLQGVVHPLSDVPDQIFAQELLGPGLAIFPTVESDATVAAPIGGLIRTLHPHAFVLQVCEYAALLVHLGVDTFRDEQAFEPLTEEGLYVPPLSPITRWNIRHTIESGLAPWVTVTVMSSKDRAVEVDLLAEVGKQISAGQDLLQVLS